jgi:hypothetical protein
LIHNRCTVASLLRDLWKISTINKCRQQLTDIQTQMAYLHETLNNCSQIACPAAPSSPMRNGYYLQKLFF